jgi:precorrin-6B C5,15-methyltransferase / cobalt-precorrin-6B C5,C15-methyltransferase
MAKLVIIGIGYKPLDARARKALADTEYILGSRRLCEVFEQYPEYRELGHKIKRIDNVDQTMVFIREALSTSSADIVLLGSGDPLFYGIGARSVREFGKECVEILPDMTSLQTAFSRIGEPWDEALLISFHGGPNPEKRRRLKYGLTDLSNLLRDNDLIGILTDKDNDPPAIARYLVATFPDCRALRMFIGEEMGYPGERITEGTAEDIAGMSFVHPNVVIIKKAEVAEEVSRAGRPEVSPTNSSDAMIIPRFGLKESEFSHPRGLITKNEVRAVTIHFLRLPEKGVLWDIGSGSGSVAIEAARLFPGLDVYGIEKNEEHLAHIERNKVAFKVTNFTVVSGEAPAALEPLPAPDRVFIGGSGGNLRTIAESLGTLMPKGIAVINAATIETLGEAVKSLEETGFVVSVSQISVARSKPAGSHTYLSGLNPVFVIVGERK